MSYYWSWWDFVIIGHLGVADFAVPSDSRLLDTKMHSLGSSHKDEVYARLTSGGDVENIVMQSSGDEAAG